MYSSKPTIYDSFKTTTAFLSLAIVCIIFLLASNVANTTPNEIITDENYQFEIEVPSDWKIQQRAKEKTDLLRLSLISPQNTIIFKIFALKAEGMIDLEKLAKLDQKFSTLGQLDNSEKKSNYIQKKYQPNEDGLFAKARFISTGKRGYILVAYSKVNEFTDAEVIFNNFKFENATSESTGGWITFLLGFAFLLLVNLSGRLFKSGSILIKTLNRTKSEVANNEKKIDYKKFYKFKRKAYFKIFIGLAGGIVAIYSIIYFVSDSWYIFLGSVVTIFAYITGWFGYILIPGLGGLQD